MNVPSLAFLGYAAAVALLINISSAPAWRRTVLLPANLGFILTFTHDAKQLAPFALLLALGFFALKLLERHKSKLVFIALLAALLLSFAILKRYTFVPNAMFLTFVYLTVGMSYVFFRVLHLVIDAYQDALPERIGLVDYVNYTLSFTSLISGPIQLYPDYRRTESVRPALLDAPAAARAVERIIVGFFKVAVVSPLLFYVQAEAVRSLAPGLPLQSRVVDGALVLVTFPVYLYVNFSGYMDFVIGAARFLRLELPENFNAPFISQGFIELWNRWHMTLSNWLKTYVYSPLLLSLMRRFPSKRVEPYLGVLAYFVTFFLIGVWHGPTSMFIFFGLLLGLGVSVNKLYQILMTKKLGRKAYRALCSAPLYAALSRGLTFLWFAFSMLWFWSSWGQLEYFAWALGGTALFLAPLLVLLGGSAALAVLAYCEGQLPAMRSRPWKALASPYVRTAWCTVLAVLVLSVTVLLNAPAPHVVYRGF